MPDGGISSEVYIGDRQGDMGEKAFLKKAELRLNAFRRELQQAAPPTNPEERQRRDSDLRQLFVLEEHLAEGDYSVAELASEPVRFSDPTIAERYRAIVTPEQPKAVAPESLAEAAPESVDNVVPFESVSKSNEGFVNAAERRDEELETYTDQVVGYYNRLFTAATLREGKLDYVALDKALSDTPGEFAQDIRQRFEDPENDDKPVELVMEVAMLQQLEKAGQQMSERLGVDYDDAVMAGLKQRVLERLRRNPAVVESPRMAV